MTVRKYDRIFTFMLEQCYLKYLPLPLRSHLVYADKCFPVVLSLVLCLFMLTSLVMKCSLFAAKSISKCLFFYLKSKTALDQPPLSLYQLSSRYSRTLLQISGSRSFIADLFNQALFERGEGKPHFQRGLIAVAAGNSFGGAVSGRLQLHLLHGRKIWVLNYACFQSNGGQLVKSYASKPHSSGLKRRTSN